MNILTDLYGYITPPKKYAKNKLSWVKRIFCFLRSFFKKSKFREANNELYFLNRKTRLAISKAKETGVKYGLYVLLEKYKSLSSVDMYNLMFSDKGKTYYQILCEYFFTIDVYRTLKITYEEKEYTYEEIVEELSVVKEYEKYKELYKGVKNV